MPYKHIFGQTYPATALTNFSANDVFLLSAEGQLSINLNGEVTSSSDSAEIADRIDIGILAAINSAQVLSFGDERQVVTAGERYSLSIEALVHDGSKEYWLIHSDNTSENRKRLKLNTQGKSKISRPRIAVSAGGGLFLADDGGTIRVYSADSMADLGAFQMAHLDSDNQVIALTVSSDEHLIAGLSSWKDIVVYDVRQRRTVFVRQIKDNVGWYVPALAQITIIGDAEVIAAAGLGRDNDGHPNLSVNVFRQVSLVAMSRSVPESPDSSSR